ncbi:MAG: MATE family efflux transporter [Asticcacaulis sp.]
MKRLVNIDAETRAAFAALYRLAWPVILTRVGTQLMALLDTIVVGQYDSRQLAFNTLGITLSWVPALTGMGLLMGVQVKTSHFLGANDHHRIGAVFQRGVRYALGLGLAAWLIVWLAGPAMLNLMVRPDLAQGAAAPLRLFALSLPAFLVTVACSNFLEALGRPRDVLIATLLANGLNVVLLLVFVPAHIRFAGMEINGAVGAALATLIARSALCAGLMIYILTLKQTRDFGLLTRHPRDDQGAREQRHVGYATGASFFIEVAAFSGMTLFAGQAGEAVVAAWAIVLNFASIVFMVPLGLATGCSVLVGRAYGAGDKPGVARTGRVGFLSAAGFMSLVVLTVLAASTVIARFYTHDPGLTGVAATGLLLSCAFYIPDGLQVVAAQALRARHDIAAPTFIHYFSYGAVMLPLGYWLCVTLNLGVSGLVLAVVAASLLSGTFQTGRFLWLDRGRERLPGR